MLAITDTITDPAAWGAFLTGVAAVFGTWRTFKRIKKGDEADCDKRVEEIRSTYRKGLETGLQLQERPPRRRASGE